MNSFRLSDQEPLCKTIGQTGLQNIIGKLSHLKNLCLKSCGLNKAPDISLLNDLVLLDISYNNINRVHNSFSHKKITKLYIQGNPLEMIHISAEKFLQLEILECGSEYTKSVSESTLRRCVDESLSIEISEDFRSHLELSAYAVIAGGPSVIEKYLDEEELDLRNVKREFFPVFKENIKTRQKPYTALRMSKYQWVHEKLNDKLILNYLQSIESLYLSASGLNTFSEIFCFEHLKHVEFSDSNPKDGVILKLPKSVTKLVAKNCGLKTT